IHPRPFCPSSSYTSPHHPHLHSFPTRRSSDLLSHLAKGDLGTSLVNGTPITELLATHARNSLVLGLTALAISYLIAIPLGVLARSEEHTSELQSRENLVCRLLLEKKKNKRTDA